MAKSFKELGIKITHTNLVGEKIHINRILNLEITVHGYQIENSKHYTGTKCLWMQIEYKDKMAVVFSSSKCLMQALEQIDKNDFPFVTTIVENSKRHEFS